MALSARTLREMATGAAKVQAMAPQAKLNYWEREKRIKIQAGHQYVGVGVSLEVTTVHVGPLTFTEPTSKYPSEELFAQVAVALAGNADKQ